MELIKKKVGLLTFGITLIMVGSIIMINQLTQYQVLKDFYLLWPIFLIMLGLEFILTKLYYDYKHKDIQLSPSILSIILAVVIIFTSSIWTNFDMNTFRFNFNFRNNWLSNYQYRITESYQPDPITLEGAEKLVVNNLRGAVDIKPGDDNVLRLEAKITIDTNNKEIAQEIIDQIIQVKNGAQVTVLSQNPTMAGKNDHMIQSVNLILYVPKNIEVTVDTRFGVISIRDMENHIAVKQEHSHVDINNINGNVVINSRYADIQVRNITGNLSIMNAHGEVDAVNITGFTEIENSYKSIRVDNIGKDAVIRSRHGEVHLDNIQGNARVNNEYKNTVCRNIAGNATISAAHSAITLENISGSIHAETSYKTMRLSNNAYTHADIKANTTHSAITWDSALQISSNNQNNLQEAFALFGDGSQTIRLNNRHGDIRIEGN